MVGNQGKKLLYKMIGSIEFSDCGLKITECTHSFLFCGGGEDNVCPEFGIVVLCKVAHAKRALHIRYPNTTSEANR